ncbi:uncharacterized protein N7484_002142 [Penicillium longicatenatum]|uniref:uncharacterized protein n=1 Tax=Penicillium longicatenatum TaxID=1561947 RepID=UPI00254927A3|nr:uncharacterized protein N7484_002142 [Penicillium longicatenatum]KAJ5658493.1 hypothetical protein N7484_002142 [Penicillium longicatenatum]
MDRAFQDYLCGKHKDRADRPWWGGMGCGVRWGGDLPSEDAVIGREESGLWFNLWELGYEREGT